MSGGDELEAARVEVMFQCDDECPTPLPMVLASGFVEAEEFALSGRNRGRFDFEFEFGHVWGTYDVVAP